MTSVKIKFRASTVNGSPGSIYFQIIHNRVVRQLHTDYKIYPHEWDADTESIIVSGERQVVLASIRERLHWDLLRLEKVIKKLFLLKIRKQLQQQSVLVLLLVILKL